MTSHTPDENGGSKALRQGVVAVCTVKERFLVIQRSRHVEAPLTYCFPGGGVESGEGEAVALVREMQEELACAVRPVTRLWQSQADWGVQLAWWQVALPDLELRPPNGNLLEATQALMVANSREVAAVHWLSEPEMRELPSLLTSNLAFLDAWRQGEFALRDLHGTCHTE